MKWEDHKTVMLIEECSVIVQKKLPLKLKDARSSTILCTIGNSFFDKPLCNLDVSVNLIFFLEN